MPNAILNYHLQHRENVGLLGSTRVGSRRVIQISAGFMIFFSMLGNIFFEPVTLSCINKFFQNSEPITSAGKFGALFASIPFTIFAAIYCVMFGIVGKHHSRQTEIPSLSL
jgi:nucleobase transporter 1/2